MIIIKLNESHAVCTTETVATTKKKIKKIKTAQYIILKFIVHFFFFLINIFGRTVGFII